MRCFGRAFLTGLGLAATSLAFDLMVLRAEDLAAALWPDHFFFTAGCAAARDVAFFLAMDASLLCLWREANTNLFCRVGQAQPAHPQQRDRNWHGGHAALCPP